MYRISLVPLLTLLLIACSNGDADRRAAGDDKPDSDRAGTGYEQALERARDVEEKAREAAEKREREIEKLEEGGGGGEP